MMSIPVGRISFAAMRAALLCLPCLLGCLPLSAQVADGRKGPDIEFAESTHNYGTIKEGGKEYCQFRFTNTGDLPLEIRNVTASCGCTTPSYPKAPIAPGASGVIDVAYNTEGRPGNFNKTVTVYTNSVLHPTYALTIRGTVAARQNTPEALYPKAIGHLRLRKTTLALGDARIGSIRTETIPIYNENEEESIKVSFSRVPRHIKVVVSNNDLQGGETAIITVNYITEEADDYGHREDEFDLHVHDQDGVYTQTIPISINLEEDFSETPSNRIPVARYSASQIDFGKVRRGDKCETTITLTNGGTATLHLRKAAVFVKHLDVKADRREAASGKSIQLKVTLNTADLMSTVKYYFEVITDDPLQPRKRITVTAHIEE